MKILLLNAPHALEEILLELSWKLPSCWLAFIVLDVLCELWGEKSSAGLLDCGPHVLQTDPPSNVPTRVIMACHKGTITTLAVLEAVSTNGNPLVTVKLFSSLWMGT